MKENSVLEKIMGVCWIIEGLLLLIMCKNYHTDFSLVKYIAPGTPRIIYGIVFIISGGILIWLGCCLKRDSESLAHCIGKTKIVEKELDYKWNDSKPKSTSNATNSKTIGCISQKTIECPVCGKRNKASDECCSNCFSPLHDGYKKE